MRNTSLVYHRVLSCHRADGNRELDGAQHSALLGRPGTGPSVRGLSSTESGSDGYWNLIEPAALYLTTISIMAPSRLEINS